MEAKPKSGGECVGTETLAAVSREAQGLPERASWSATASRLGRGVCPEVLGADRVAEVVLDAVWSLREHTEYEVQSTRNDVNWGADTSLVEVVVDISSVIASTCTVAELADRIRDRLKARREQSEGDS